MPHLLLAALVSLAVVLLKKALELVLENEYATWAPAVARFLVRVAGFAHRPRRGQWEADLLYQQRVRQESACSWRDLVC